MRNIFYFKYIYTYHFVEYNDVGVKGIYKYIKSKQNVLASSTLIVYNPVFNSYKDLKWCYPLILQGLRHFWDGHKCCMVNLFQKFFNFFVEFLRLIVFFV